MSRRFRESPESDSRASRRYHDRVARQYDNIYDDPYWDFHDRLTWEHVKPYLPRDLTTPVSDLGCGTGKWGLKLLKSGFHTTFLDNAAAMIEEVRKKLEAQGPRAKRATLVVNDIIAMNDLPDAHFGLTLAMGDPLSICSDPVSAVREMFRITRPGGLVIASADNKLAAIDHFVEKGNVDALHDFLKTGRTNWLTGDERERFELTTFTPQSLRKLFEKSGFDVLDLIGKPVIPVRANKLLLSKPDAIDTLLKLEAELQRDPTTAGRAAHLQIVARKAEEKKTD